MVPLAITTGNAVVLKAASQTSLTSMRILEFFYEEAGFPKAVVNLVTCSHNWITVDYLFMGKSHSFGYYPFWKNPPQF